MTQQRPGVVRDAIMAVFKDADTEVLRLPEIHAGVEKRLGNSVASSSVRSYLNINTPRVFLRVGHGQYRLRK